MKATHQGSCQVCGHFQKLPNNRLALHGYTTRWGFFSGTCEGSKHLPFEVSCDLIKSAIERTKALVLSTQEEIDGLKTSEGPRVWVNIYKPATWERGSKSSYVWQMVELKMEEKPYSSGGGSYMVFTYTIAEGSGDVRTVKVDAYTTDGGYNVSARTMAEAARYLNGKRIAKLAHDIQQMTAYIDWQTERVNNWKPGTLTEVK
jgi:hypothetical protein